MTSRVFNFSPGPSMLPESVIHQIHAELLDYQGSGMSIMEVSHRGESFMEIVASSKNLLRQLLNIPDDYHILFMTGGAQMQCAAVPLNLLGEASCSVAYLDTGIWSRKAAKEAEKYAKVSIVATTEHTPSGLGLPSPDDFHLKGDEAYLHYVDNETIDGLEFTQPPFIPDLPLVADMSSNILSKPIDIERFALIYACAQKNLGISGITLVIVREDFLGRAHSLTPSLLNYTLMKESDSLYNTPPTFPWYVAWRVLEWIAQRGGVQAMNGMAKRRSQKLYTYIDHSNFYHNPVAIEARSRMNVPFTIQTAGWDKAFLAQAEQVGLSHLKGHRLSGGMRASLYNAMPEAGVDALMAFMQSFKDQVG